SFDVAGWFAMTPGLFRRVGPVLLEGETVAANPTSLIVADDAFAQSDAEVAAAGRLFLERAAAALPSTTNRTVAPDGFDGWREAFRVIQAREVWETYGDFVRRAKPRLGPGVKERIEFSSTVTPEAADAARKTATTGRAHLRSLLTPGTLMAL